MPARKWKWRMRGAAVTMADRTREGATSFDVVLASDFLDLATFKALLGRPTPAVAYFHENQLTYPVAPEDERDYQFAFTNITTCLAAERVLFNSRYHLESMLGAVDELLRRMPDEVPRGVPGRIRSKARVVPVGLDLARIDALRPQATGADGPLLVLWNHRWEYDKGPAEFLEVMMELAQQGAEFRLALTGEQFRTVPATFDRARRALGDRLVQFGYVRRRDDYIRLMLRSDVVVSTAHQEFFGISVVEAVYAGCFPLLPRRLTYPELLPRPLHERCIYAGRDELAARLRGLCADPSEARAFDHRLGRMDRFSWDAVAPQLDAAMEAAAQGR
jgi:glycosyltransferase involved in cell wall biosynthesis